MPDTSATITQDGDSVALQANDIETILTLDPSFDADTFVGASDLDEETGFGQILGFSETENTYAALLLTRDEGVVAQTFFGRSGSFDAAAAGGSATLEGTYVGVIENPEEDQLRSYITGTAVFDVDLDAMTISGEVTEATTDLYGLGLQLSLSEEHNPSFPESAILSDGTFGTTGEQTGVDDETGDVIVTTTDYSGLLSGTTVENAELVGTVSESFVRTNVRNNATVTSTSQQTGVFAVGH